MKKGIDIVMRKTIYIFLAMVFVLGTLAGCGVAKKSEALLFSATEDELKGFEEHFSIKNSTGDVSESESRYNFIYVKDESGLDQKEHSPTFIIPIYDDGNTAKISIIYTAGAQSENPTISNSNWLSGTSTVIKSMTVNPGTGNKAERAKIISKAIYDSLVDIEGK